MCFDLTHEDVLGTLTTVFPLSPMQLQPYPLSEWKLPLSEWKLNLLQAVDIFKLAYFDFFFINVKIELSQITSKLCF